MVKFEGSIIIFRKYIINFVFLVFFQMSHYFWLVSATDENKTGSTRTIQQIVEETSDLIGNKIADKIKITAWWNNPTTASQTDEESVEIWKERYILRFMSED